MIVPHFESDGSVVYYKLNLTVIYPEYKEIEYTSKT